MKAHKFAMALDCDAPRSAPESGSAGAPRAFSKAIRALGSFPRIGFRRLAAPHPRSFFAPTAADSRIEGPVYNEEIAIGRDEARRLRKSRNVRVAASTKKPPRAGRHMVAALTRCLKVTPHKRLGNNTSCRIWSIRVPCPPFQEGTHGILAPSGDRGFFVDGRDRAARRRSLDHAERETS